MTSIRVAAVQAEPVWFDAEATVAKTIVLIDEAAASGADLVAFPETWIPGYPIFLWTHPAYQQTPFVMQYHVNSIAIDGPEVAAIRTAALRHGIAVAFGFSEKVGGSLYMAQAIIDRDGSVLLHRRKLKPTHVERTLFGESDGSGIKVVDSSVGRVGALNCWEHLQPLTKFAMYSQDEQLHVAGWPCFGFLKQVSAFTADVNMAVTRTYAVEGGTFVLASTQIISPENVALFNGPDGAPSPIVQGGGGSARIYGPDGALLTEPVDEFADAVVTADIDLGSIVASKNATDPVGHYARPDVTRLIFDDRPRSAVVSPPDLEVETPAFPPLEDEYLTA